MVDSIGQRDRRNGHAVYLQPPRPVWVDLAVVFPLRGGRPTRSIPDALDLQARVPGTLSSWHLTTTGDWVGYCRFDIRHGDMVVVTSQWVPAEALEERADGPARPK